MTSSLPQEQAGREKAATQKGESDRAKLINNVKSVGFLALFSYLRTQIY